MLPSGLIIKRATQSVTNRTANAACLQQATGSPIGSVNLTGISSSGAIGAKGRRRRDIQCDKTDRSGTAIVFDIVLNCPPNLQCKTLYNEMKLFLSIHEKFNNVTNVNIITDDGSYIPVELCHVQPYPNLNSYNYDNKDANGVIIELLTTTTTATGTITTATTTEITTTSTTTTTTTTTVSTTTTTTTTTTSTTSTTTSTTITTSTTTATTTTSTTTTTTPIPRKYYAKRFVVTQTMINISDDI
ncbi:unnamed protein product [Adineta steineri]|uniref:Uncharacterized protein n=1 Tax=Adineta steineri TaxID=433720 RepID=A0A815Z1Z8_9BILA|nr:unnamed protein product [Adineta steineri]CAF1577765.1 unnamed protein product [Adineta steineri]